MTSGPRDQDPFELVQARAVRDHRIRKTAQIVFLVLNILGAVVTFSALMDSPMERNVINQLLGVVILILFVASAAVMLVFQLTVGTVQDTEAAGTDILAALEDEDNALAVNATQAIKAVLHAQGHRLLQSQLTGYVLAARAEVGQAKEQQAREHVEQMVKLPR